MASPSSRTYVVEGMKISLEVLKAMANAIPGPWSDVIGLAQKAIETSETLRTSREDCASLRSRILQLLPVMMATAKNDAINENGRNFLPQYLIDNIERFQKNLESILKTLDKVNDDLVSKRLVKKFKAFVLSNPYASAIKQCKDDLDWAVAAFEVTSRVEDAIRLCELTTTVHAILNDRRLENLPRAKYASHSSERPDRPSTCFEGTRTSIIDLIFNWVYDPDPASDQIFFLNGIAGVGKTTIARTVAEKSRNDGLLGGDFFFCRQGEADLRDASKVFPTLAYQLAHFHPDFGQRIVEALEKHPQAPYEGLKQQLDRLIIEPLSNIKRDAKRTVVLVFDAFDECDPRGAKEILQLLLTAIPSLPFFLKIFLTGRPEHHILSVLAKPTQGLATTALHDIEPLIVKSDIGRYLRAKLAELPGELGVELPAGWATEEEIELLIEKSDGLFIYAVTVMRFLCDHFVLNPPLQLKILMEVFRSSGPGPTNAQPFRDLDALYMQLLRCALSSTNLDYVIQTLQAVVGTIVILRDPLPQAALEGLAGLQPGEATSSLRQLQSVILPARPPDHCPTIYHPSFPDFIQDPRRCTDERFHIDTSLHEARMALTCLRLINSELRKDMMADLGDAVYNSDVEDLESKVATAYRPAVQYACRHWASHLETANHDDRNIVAALESFARRSLVFLLEAISWLGATRAALRCMEIAKKWALTSGCSSDAEELLNDCHRLLSAHFSTITDSAPHITRSVLPFMPQGTLFASIYREYSDRSLKVIRGVDMTWSLCLVVINIGTGVVSINFSSDQTRLACLGIGVLGGPGVIQIVDPSTGANLSSVTLAANRLSQAESITFTPSGSVPRRPDPFYEGIARISPDGRRLASVASGLVRLWNTGDDAAAVTLEGNLGTSIQNIAFSPDSRHLATAGLDSLVQIWDADSGMHLVTMNGHSEAVYPLAFSSDGCSLASGSQDKTIRIWDLNAPNSAKVLRGHSRSVSALDFSPDSKYIVSGSEDHLVLLWSVGNESIVTVFRGHMYDVTSVAFSTDGARVASASMDYSVRVWDATPGRTYGSAESSLPQPGSSTTSPPMGVQLDRRVLFSPDGAKLAYSFTSGRRNYLHVMTAADVMELEGPEGNHFKSTSLSQDGRWVAGCSAGVVCVWDSSTGESIVALEAELPWFGSVALTLDGTRVAVASEYTIRVWAVANATLTSIVDTASRLRIRFDAITFSPDGESIASGSTGGSVHIWNVTSRSSTWSSTSSSNTGLAMVNNRPVAEEPSHDYSDGDICRIQTPEVTMSEGSEAWGMSDLVAFFPDGYRIACLVDSSSTRALVWNATSGTSDKVSEVHNVQAATLFVGPHGHSNSLHGGRTHTLAIATFDKRGQLRLQIGDRRSVWVLPPTIDTMDQQLIRRLEAPMALTQSEPGDRFQCAIASKMGGVFVLDLQM